MPAGAVCASYGRHHAQQKKQIRQQAPVVKQLWHGPAYVAVERAERDHEQPCL